MFCCCSVKQMEKCQQYSIFSLSLLFVLFQYSYKLLCLFILPLLSCRNKSIQRSHVFICTIILRIPNMHLIHVALGFSINLEANQVLNQRSVNIVTVNVDFFIFNKLFFLKVFFENLAGIYVFYQNSLLETILVSQFVFPILVTFK